MGEAGSESLELEEVCLRGSTSHRSSLMGVPMESENPEPQAGSKEGGRADVIDKDEESWRDPVH